MSREFRAQVVGAQGGGDEVERSGEGADAGQSGNEVNLADDVQIDRQAVALMAGAGIGEIDAVEQDEGLVVRTAADRYVGLHALGAAFAKIDGGVDAQYAFDGLQRRDGERVAAVHFRGSGNSPCGIQSFGGHVQRLEFDHTGHLQRIRLSGYAFWAVRDDRHRERQHADLHYLAE